jgi:endoglucanase
MERKKYKPIKSNDYSVFDSKKSKEVFNNNFNSQCSDNIDRIEFLKIMGFTLGATLIPEGIVRSIAEKHSTIQEISDITYNTLPKWRGFNLLEKFTHKPDEWLNIAPEWGYKNEPFRESDFALIKELGFNYVRLPMSYKCWCDENDWYKLKEKHLMEIDNAVEYGKQYGLHICINFHRSPGYTVNDDKFLPQYREKITVWDDEETLKACAFHWNHFAERYKGISNTRLSFNLFNEPYSYRTTEEKHDKVIRFLVDQIRSIDPNRLIAIDGFDFRPSTNLIDLKIAQCARGYNPSVVTHYKSAWVRSSDVLPTWPMKDKNEVLWDKTKLVESFNPWKELSDKGIGIYVGEFGVYNQTPHDVTLRFLKDNLEIWNNYNWGWAMWCFRGSFGIADSGRKDVKYEKYKGIMLDREMCELLNNR